MGSAKDQDKWEFDAPKYWDFTRPDQDSDAIDKWFASHSSPKASSSSSSQNRERRNTRTVESGSNKRSEGSLAMRHDNERRETSSFVSRQHRPISKSNSISTANHASKRRDIFSALAAAQTASSSAKQVSATVPSSSSSKSQQTLHNDTRTESSNNKQTDVLRRLTSLSSALRKSIAPSEASDKSAQNKGKGVDRKNIPGRPTSTAPEKIRRNLALELESRKLDSSNLFQQSANDKEKPTSHREPFGRTQKDVTSDDEMTKRPTLPTERAHTRQAVSAPKRGIDEVLKELALRKNETENTVEDELDFTTTSRSTSQSNIAANKENITEKEEAAEIHLNEAVNNDLQTENPDNEIPPSQYKNNDAEAPSPSRWPPPQQEEMVQLPARIESIRRSVDRQDTRRSSKSSIATAATKLGSPAQRQRLSVNDTRNSQRPESTFSLSSHRTQPITATTNAMESTQKSMDGQDTRDDSRSSLSTPAAKSASSAQQHRLPVSNTGNIQRRESMLSSSSHRTQRTTVTTNTIASTNDLTACPKPRTESSHELPSLKLSAPATVFDDNDVIMKPTDFDGLFEKMEEIKRQLQLVAKTSAIRPIESQLTKNMGTSIPRDPPRVVVISTDSIDERIQRAKRIMEDSKQRSKMWFVRVPEKRLLDYDQDYGSPKRRAYLEEKDEDKENDKLKKSRYEQEGDGDASLIGKDNNGASIADRIAKLQQSIDLTPSRRTSRVPKPVYLPIEPTIPKSPHFATDARHRS